MNLLSVFLAAVLALSGLPITRQSQPVTPVLSLYPASGPAGTQVNLVLAGLEKDATPALWMDDTPLESAPLERDGSQVVVVNVPARAEPGAQVVFRAAGAGFDLHSSFLVTDALPPYTVRQGDSFESIAAWFGVYAADLRLDNLDTRVYGLEPGRKLLIPARRDRAIPLARASQASPLVLEQVIQPGERWVDVNLALQQVNVYEGTRLQNQFSVSTGVRKHPTLAGNFKVYIKYEKGNMGGPGYYLVNVPSILYYDRGYALHGTYWHNNFGTPMSHGCVNLSEEDAAWLFDFLPLGGLIMIHD